MYSSDIKKVSGKRLAREVASRQTDPNFYGVLSFLPNPDSVLRKLGKSHEVFNAIWGDAHVVGELRSIRSGLLSYESRLQVGGDSPADMRAFELCSEWFYTRPPAPGMRWPDTLWNIYTAMFFGQRIHEVVWGEKRGGLQMPVAILDRPNRRFVYDHENRLRVKTRAKPIYGELVDEKKFLVSRHMPSAENPYGVALFSACFWPYTFKHGGFKYFVKFCEKYGLPWAVGKHPRGTPQKEVDELLDSLAQMVEDGVAAIPDDGSVDLITASSTGTQLPQERLIAACNREISKALTSQTLATEINGEASRAAADTHRQREVSVQEADREIVCDTMNELFAWITEVNVAGARPPRFEFYEEEEVQIGTAEFIGKAREVVEIPKAWAYRKLQIPEPQDGEDVIEPGGAMQSTAPAFSSCPGCGEQHDFSAHDDAIDKLASQATAESAGLIAEMAKPIRDLLNRVESLEEFSAGLVELYPAIDETRLAELNQQALLAGVLKGMSDIKGGENK